MQISALLVILGAIAVVSSATAEMQCSPHIVAAASGIHLNIVGQESELASVKMLQKIESNASDQGYLTQFEMEKGVLIATIEGGMSIRAFNQKVLPANNGANAGLETVKGAQKIELDLAKSLTGKPKHDHKVLATLFTDIENGTAQNKKNLAAAIKGCKLGVKVAS